MYILGISAFYHDSASCLINDETIVAAAQEERFTRRKHDDSFPTNAIQYCVDQAGIKPENIDAIVFYEKPFMKFERLLETYLAFAPHGFNHFSKVIPIWLKDKLFQKTKILREIENTVDKNIDWNDKLLFSEHHLSHAASAYYPSPFQRAAVLTLDGVGEWSTTSLALGLENDLKVYKEIHFPHSIGLLYSAFTYYTGFKVNSGEYKVMGLAPYGEPRFYKLIKENLIDIKEDGSFHLNMHYFDFCTGFTMTNKNFNRLFGAPPRKPESALTNREMDIAASIQKVTEEIIVKLAKSIAKETQEENLCMAGGVALNCVANGVLLREGIFKNIWIQPASGDAGGSLGAALAAYHLMYRKPRSAAITQDKMQGSFLGPKFEENEIKTALSALGAHYEKNKFQEIIKITGKALAKGKAIGWMQGRMEFGPRSLGARSIIADPRSPYVQKQLNLKVKFRESFRPFAPSIMRDKLNEWFELDVDSPYMLFVADVVKSKCHKMTDEENALFGIDKLNVARSEVPAVTHVDYSARIHTVDKETNPYFYDLLKYFYDITNCPILVNTSFNVRGEPIVCSPADAFRCFMGTELDMLIIDNFVLHKEDQDINLRNSYEDKYDLD
jgi:carbamoyltransferase